VTPLRQLPRLRRATDPVVRPTPEAAIGDLEREFEPTPTEGEGQRVTKLLFARLDEADVAEVERRVAQAPDLELPSNATDPALRQTLLLTYGMWLGVSAVAEKTRLPVAQPPDSIHAMARGPLAAAGGLYDADIIVDVLNRVGLDMGENVEAALDFGCSSGRLLRVLAAAYPNVRWLGCDPNAPAIAWAVENLPGIKFFVSSNEPPLEVADGCLDIVSAISIWSHFEPELGLRWFDEMHRIIRPGGRLVCTTHGLTSVAFFADTGTRSLEQSREIAAALYRRGWWYAAEFGDAGDWGVVSPSWGTAFVSPEWLLASLCPGWRVLDFAPGRNQNNQDVYLLERG
jgi:SAM-dependent methyltransferase